MKTGSRCKIEKPLDEFNKNKSRKDGLQLVCRLCRNEYLKNRRHIDYKLRLEKIEKTPNFWRELYNKRKEKEGEKLLEYNRNYRQKNKQYFRDWDNKNYCDNPLYRLKTILGVMIRKGLNGERKYLKTQEIVGCSWEELKHHLESQFQLNMTWDNHGQYGWHIDHIIPLASAKTEEEIYKLNHYTNLQPLWWEDNLEKGDKLVWNKLK